MTQHTPGPWYVSAKNPFRVIESGPRSLSLAKANNKHLSVTTELTETEAKANARLIAAAPDLLASLQEVTATLAWLNSDDSAHIMEQTDRARAAIAKATGEQS